MSITFLGAKNAGSVHTSQNSVNKPQQPVAMTWNALWTTGDVAQQQLGVPGLNALSFSELRASWYKYTFDPAANQGSFNFGVGKTLQLNVSRVQSYNVANNSFYFVGRVVIYVPSTGQTFVVGPKTYSDVVWPISGGSLPTSIAPYESSNDVLPIVLSSSSQVEIWLEGDISNTGTGDNSGIPTSSVVATLFNFELPPVSVG